MGKEKERKAQLKISQECGQDEAPPISLSEPSHLDTSTALTPAEENAQWEKGPLLPKEERGVAQSVAFPG